MMTAIQAPDGEGRGGPAWDNARSPGKRLGTETNSTSRGDRRRVMAQCALVLHPWAQRWRWSSHGTGSGTSSTRRCSRSGLRYLDGRLTGAWARYERELSPLLAPPFLFPLTKRW